MSTPRVDVGGMTGSHPCEPVRLTTGHINADDPAEAPATTTWPLGHPRAADPPIPAARWTGRPQPLQAVACPGSLQDRWPDGAVMVRGSCEAATVGADARQAMIDRIDVELHAGRPVAVSLESTDAPDSPEDRPAACWMHLVARNYWPDGTVYYLGLVEWADEQLDVRLYVRERDFALVKRGPKSGRCPLGLESVVTGIAIAQG